jgi:hypothetical protein
MKVPLKAAQSQLPGLRLHFREVAQLFPARFPLECGHRGRSEFDRLSCELAAEAKTHAAQSGRRRVIAAPGQIALRCFVGVTHSVRASMRNMTSFRRRNDGVHGGSKYP